MRHSRQLAAFFERAKAYVESEGYRSEYEYQRSILDTSWSETDFLREYSWVVFCCGFREQVVRRWFSYISMAFFDFVSSREIVKHHRTCRELALAAIKNRQKVDAVIETARRIDESGFPDFQAAVLANPVAQLTSLSYIGSITCNHVLKNLGFDVAKNDRHLARICKALHFDEARSLCEQISDLTGEPPSVVDTVLWRYSELLARTQSGGWQMFERKEYAT